MTVVEQVLTGTFADGLGNVRKVPNRIDFDPFPWQSFAVWILTQMKRWGQIKGEVDYAKVAREVFLATDAAKLMKEAGLKPPDRDHQEVHGHGQGVRSGEAGRRISRASRSSGRWHERCKERLAASGLGRAAALARDPVSCCSSACWHVAHGAGARRKQVGRATEYAKLRRQRPPRQGRSRRLPTPARGRREALGAPDRPVLRQRPQRQGHRHPARLFDRACRRSASCSPALVAMPLGFLIGMSPLLYRALDPFIQVLKPISPLAWMPLALYTHQGFAPSRRSS